MLKMIPIVALAVATSVLAGCEEEADLAKSRATQQSLMERANAAVPAYEPTQFAGREDINWSLRETEGRHTWFVYALAMDGTPLFYVVSDMKPRNKCISITAPDRVIGGAKSRVAVSAPALTGTYFGGANCQTFYMRDAQTQSYIELSGSTFTIIASKAPLPIETDQLRPQVRLPQPDADAPEE